MPSVIWKVRPAIEPISTPVPSGYSGLAEKTSDLRTISHRPPTMPLQGEKNEKVLFTGVHRHPVHSFRLLRKFPERRQEEHTNGSAGLGCASQYISRGRASGCASHTVGRTGESTSLAL